MSQMIAGFPYWEVRFDEDGQLVEAAGEQTLTTELPGRRLTDLFVFAHGWNNDVPTARKLFSRFFTNLWSVQSQLGQPGRPRRRGATAGAVGVIWPSMRWIDEDTADDTEAAALPVAYSDAQLVDSLKAMFVRPGQAAILDELKQLLTDRPRNSASLFRFQELLRQLVGGYDVTVAPEDNGEAALLSQPPHDVFLRLAAITPVSSADDGGAAGLLDPLRRIWDGAKNALRVATFWEMKKRAGKVGQIGLGPLLGRLARVQPDLNIHLLGHSFGARLVSFALTGLPNNAASPVKSIFLLQGAFSHFAFTASLPQDPARSGALAEKQRRVAGPIAVTHTQYDTAVGTWYPLACMPAGDDAAALDDVLYTWGAMGHDGAQFVPLVPEVVLGTVGTAYAYPSAGQFVNLKADGVIRTGGFPSGAHSDIIHDEISWAVLCMAGIAGASTATAELPAEPAEAVMSSTETEGGAASLAAAVSPGAGNEPAEPLPRGESEPPATPAPSNDDLIRSGPTSWAFALPEELKEKRLKIGLRAKNDQPGPVMVELNLLHAQSLPGAERRFKEMYVKVTRRPAAGVRLIANTYLHCFLSVDEVNRLVEMDRRGKKPSERAVYHIWPDFPIEPCIDRSVVTVKADAARRTFNSLGQDIVWAVIDSGINGLHPHFGTYRTLDGDVAELHWDFTFPGEPGSDPRGIARALEDDTGHGSHVAGILGGGLPAGAVVAPIVAQNVALDANKGNCALQSRTVDPSMLSGVAPRTSIVSFRVLRQDINSSSNVLRALQYIREKLNGNGKMMRVHGVNLSLGYEFDAKWFACGQSPICVEVDRLVRSGVVVVVAAGNTGYGELQTVQRSTSTGLGLTINDPGNAAGAITVGATHRDQPYTYGVSYFSSKGPTGDGRMKPDLIAPGERITSCAAGKALTQMQAAGLLGAAPAAAAATLPAYIDDSGTSMAAPHVSGAIAAFLSIRREFIGQPEKVKEIFLESASSLGRERYFEGHGLVDLMRAIQAV
jgi:serine protease AprX